MPMTKERRREYDAKRPNRRSTKGPSALSAFQRGYFVAWDGEGATVDGRHTYIMLLTSEGDIRKDAEGMTSEQIIPFLMDCAAKYPKNTVHVIFGGGYDANMIFRTLPHKIVNLIGVPLPFIGLIVAIALLWNRAIGPLELGLMVGLYVITCLGVTQD